LCWWLKAKNGGEDRALRRRVTLTCVGCPGTPHPGWARVARPSHLRLKRPPAILRPVPP
jgi:hypothetical protein